MRNDEDLDKQYALAIRFATTLMTQPNAITGEDLDELREFFTDDQLIELHVKNTS